MATGFGVGPDQAGNGTTPDDIQRITSAEYIWPGIINRGAVTGTTEMKYKLEGGAAVISVGEVAKVKVPLFAQDIPTAPAPATGSRTDIVYVKQNFPATDGNNAVVVGVAQSLPSNALELQRFTVPAGATSTNQCTKIGNPIYTRPVGAQFGGLVKKVDSDTSVRVPGTVYTRGVGSFNLWTDSDVEVKISSCIRSITTSEYGSVFYRIYVDDILRFTWERRYDNVWETKDFSRIIPLDVGRHTVKYTVESRWIPSGMSGKYKVEHGGADRFPGDELSVIHQGVAVF